MRAGRCVFHLLPLALFGVATRLQQYRAILISPLFQQTEDVMTKLLIECAGGEEIPAGGWRGGEEIPAGGWRGGEEIPAGGWR